MTALPAHREHRIAAGDGNVLHVRDYGPADGPAVLFHHGTPSCALAVPGGWRAPAATGTRVVCIDRPGYAGSTDVAGRTVGDAARWSALVADALGIGRFAVMGASGGGPHAAAVAAALGDRVTRLCVCVGLGPVELDGFDVTAGMLEETRTEIDHARTGEAALRAFIDSLQELDEPLEAWLARLPPTDVQILARADVRVEEHAEQRDVAAGGVSGWVQDDLAMFHRPWGCRLADVSAEVLLLYGAADVLVPHTHGDAYRRAIGHGHLVKIPDAGHWMRDHEPAVLRWLSGAAALPFTAEAA